MENTMVPFSKLITVLSLAETDWIELNDTSGNPVACNYCQVDTEHNPVSNGHFFVRPDIDYHDNTVIVSGTGSPLTDPGGGGAISGQGEGVKICTPGGKTFSRIKVKNGFTAAINLLITYGVKLPYNPVSAATNTDRGI